MKRSVLTLFSGENDVISHILRLALTEKGIAYDVEYISDDPEMALNHRFANGTVKFKKGTILDKDLLIDDLLIALEYLDDKFPHPPLFATGPEKRAKTRLIVKYIEARIFPYLDQLNSESSKELFYAIEKVSQVVSEISGVIDEKTLLIYGEEFSILDCYLGPILYKLFRQQSRDARSYQIPTKVANYYRRLHNRETFIKSLQLAPSRGFMYEKGK